MNDIVYFKIVYTFDHTLVLKHLSNIVTACANFSANYNFQSIAVALLVMSVSECTSSKENCMQGKQSSWVVACASGAIFAGAVLGQLSMGYYGDRTTRNHALFVTLLIACIGSCMTAIAPAGPSTAVYAVIIVFRFVTGYGLGGIYPLSATKSAEDHGGADGRVNVVSSSWAFFWQTPGIVAPWLLGYLTALDGNAMSTHSRWRLLLGFGAVPSFAAMCGLIAEHYLKARLVISPFAATSETTSSPDTLRLDGNTCPVSGTVEIEAAGYRKHLLVSGGIWFLFDVVLYGINLLGGHIVTSFSDDDNVSSLQSVRHTTAMQAGALSLGMPAIVASIYLIPVLGLRWLCFTGFISMCMVLLVMAGLYSYMLSIHNISGLYAVYCFLCFSIQFGTAVASFSLPAALFPKSVRSTYNGMAAAAGKTGAFVGALALYPLVEVAGLPIMLVVLAVVAAAGALVTFWCLDHRLESAACWSSESVDARCGSQWSPVHTRGGDDITEHDFGNDNHQEDLEL